MDITIKVSKNQIRQVVDLALYDLEDFSEAELNAVKVKVPALITELMNNEKFMNRVRRLFTEVAQSSVDDIGDEAYELGRAPEIVSHYRRVSRAVEKLRAEQDRRAQHPDIKVAIDKLVQAGYTVRRSR